MSVKDDLEAAKEVLCEQYNDLQAANTAIAAAKQLVESALEAVCNEEESLSVIVQHVKLCGERLAG